MARIGVELTLAVDKWDIVRAQFNGGGQIGERSALMGYVRLFHLVSLPAKNENINGNCDRRGDITPAGKIGVDPYLDIFVLQTEPN